MKKLIVSIAVVVFLLGSQAQGHTKGLTTQQIVQEVVNKIAKDNSLPTSSIYIIKDTKPDISYKTTGKTKDILVTDGLIGLIDNQDQLAFLLATVPLIGHPPCNKNIFRYSAVIEFLNMQNLPGADKIALCSDIKARQYIHTAGYSTDEALKIIGKLLIANPGNDSLLTRYIFMQNYMDKIEFLII